MSNTATATQTASIYTLINGMADARREYAAEHGFTVTDEELAESIKASLLRMFGEA